MSSLELRRVVLESGNEAVYSVPPRFTHDREIAWYGVQRGVKLSEKLTLRGRLLEPEAAAELERVPLQACPCHRCAFA